MREAVAEVASTHPVVLITKGDLFHQEAKVRDSGLSDLFRRIEIVSERTPPPTRPVRGIRHRRRALPDGRQFAALGHRAGAGAGRLGGVHVPYHTTWAHEAEAPLGEGIERMRTIARLALLPAAIHELQAQASLR